MEFPLYAVVHVKDAHKDELVQVINYQPGKRSGIYGCRVVEKGEDPPVKLCCAIPSYEAGQLEMVKMSQRDKMAEALFMNCRLKELKKELELWHLGYQEKSKKADLARLLACSRVLTNLEGALSTWERPPDPSDLFGSNDDAKDKESHGGLKRSADGSRDAEDVKKQATKKQRTIKDSDDTSQDPTEEKEEDDQKEKAREGLVMKDRNMLWSGRRFLSVESTAQKTMLALDAGCNSAPFTGPSACARNNKNMSDDLASASVKAARTKGKKEAANTRFATLEYFPLWAKKWRVITENECESFQHLAQALNFLAEEGFAADVEEIKQFQKEIYSEEEGQQRYRALVFSKVLASE